MHSRNLQPLRARIFVSVIRTKLPAALIALVLAASSAPALVSAQNPQDESARLTAALDPLLNQSVSQEQIPGAVLLVGHNGRVVYRKAFGSRSLEPTREAMTADTIFDVASLTKCIATTSSVMLLWQQGRIRLNDPVSMYLPEFAQNGKQDITVRQLLTHYSGLAPDIDLKTPWQGRDAAYKMAMEQKPANPPGSRFVYSDINFETLGFIVEKISGESLDQFAQKNIFTPLGMSHTRYLPPADWKPLIAPTQYDENHVMLRGIVHDPTARRMGGVAGHAGLFSTADDLAVFAQSLLTGSTVLSRATVEKMSTPQQPANASSLRGLGWDIDSPYSTNRGELLPIGSYGHTGFTGTSLWIDPVTNTYIILLTNSVHPNGGKGFTVSLRTRVATAVAESLNLTASEDQKLRLARITGYNETLAGMHLITSRNGQVKNGIDVLEAENFSALHPDPAHPVKIGLITNQTGLDSAGRRTIDVLAHTPGIELTAIFSPEHGVAGKLDTTQIGNSKDAATGVPVYSVYGDTSAKRHPDPAVVAQLDALVYDIQDIGVRFYTYETTLGYFLEAAAKAAKPIYVLDRPNPINGVYVQGPVADANRSSFVSYWQTPIRHGMTAGELARMFNAEQNINAQLTVISMQGWMRGDWFDSTGLTWTNPSPNMRNLTEAALYPGIGMIETTNISVGRGTDTPFELIGAPWINAADLARTLNTRNLAGLRFVPVRFTPTGSVYANQECSGVNILVTDRNAVDAPELGAEVAVALHTLYPDQYKLDKIDTLIVNRATTDAIAHNTDPRRTAEDWQDQIDQFQKIRAKYLLY